jgi:hypothetical protein
MAVDMLKELLFPGLKKKEKERKGFYIQIE